jgi:hypothetical protein
MDRRHDHIRVAIIGLGRRGGEIESPVVLPPTYSLP